MKRCFCNCINYCLDLQYQPIINHHFRIELLFILISLDTMSLWKPLKSFRHDVQLSTGFILHSVWQVNDLWECKYCHSTVINAPVKQGATCIFMMVHKHCPYVTPAGKCVPHHATHLYPSRAPVAQSTEWGDVKEFASLCQTLHGEFHQGPNQKNYPLICPWGDYSQTLSCRSVAISSCFDLEASDKI